MKWEDDIKAFLGGSLTSISDQLIKISSSGKVNEIAQVVATLQEQMFSRLARLECEICRIFSEKEVGLSCLGHYLHGNVVAVCI